MQKHSMQKPWNDSQTFPPGMLQQRDNKRKYSIKNYNGKIFQSDEIFEGNKDV